MSSILTRTAQMVDFIQIREAINGQIATRDPQIEALYKEVNELEQMIEQLVKYCENLYKTLPALEFYSQGMSSILPKLYDSNTFLRETSFKISQVHQTHADIYKEAHQDCQTILEYIKKLLQIFNQIRLINTQKNKSRLVYDHYVHKLENLKNCLAKKKSKSQFYNETPKEAERFARNEMKFLQSEANLKSDNSRLFTLLNTARNSKYTHIIPAVARILRLELKMFGTLSDSIHSIKHVPDSIVKEVQDYSIDEKDYAIEILEYNREDKENKDKTDHEHLRSMTELDLVSLFKNPEIERKDSFECIKKRSTIQNNIKQIQKEENEVKTQQLFGRNLPSKVEVSYKDHSNSQNFENSYSKDPGHIDNTKMLRYPSLPIPTELQSTSAHYIATAPSQTPEFNSPYATAKPLVSQAVTLHPPAPLLPQELTQRLFSYKNSNFVQELQSRLIPSQPFLKTPSESYDPFEGLGKLQTTSIVSQMNAETSKPVSKKHD